VLHQSGAAFQIARPFVNNFSGLREELLTNYDHFDIAACGGEFGAGLGGEQWIGWRANADGERPVPLGEFTKTVRVGCNQGIEIGRDEGPAVQAGARCLRRDDLGSSIEHVLPFSLNQARFN